MKTILSLAFLFVTIIANAGNAITFAWNPNTETNLAGYRLYQGTSSRTYFTNYTATTNTVMLGTNAACTLTITNIPVAKKFYFAVTAFTDDGLESDYSDELVFGFKPEKPMELRISKSTNSLAAVWLDNVPTSTTVEWSKDLQSWQGWARISSLDAASPLNNAVFLSGFSPGYSGFWRAVEDAPVSSSPSAPLPTGLRLVPLPPLPGQ